MSKENITYKGIGFCPLLTIVFIVLKLTNVIDWSWLWVLSPFWIPTALFIIFLVLCFAALKLYDNNGKR